MNPNSFDEEVQDAQAANPDYQEVEGTEQTDTVSTESPQEIDYKTKFTESAKEAQRLYRENEELKASQVDESSNLTNDPYSNPNEPLYDGFNDLDDDAQKNLIAYTDSVTKRAKEELYKDPAIAFARDTYNKTRWEDAFTKASDAYPELKDSREEFRSQYFNAAVVPENIDDVLKDVAKIYLFDKAKDIGAAEERQKIDRVELETPTGGDKTPSVRRTLEDWERMKNENPQKFAEKTKEFNADLDSGLLVE
jgi:hypothetical protein